MKLLQLQLKIQDKDCRVFSQILDNRRNICVPRDKELFLQIALYNKERCQLPICEPVKLMLKNHACDRIGNFLSGKRGLFLTVRKEKESSVFAHLDEKRNHVIFTYKSDRIKRIPITFRTLGYKNRCCQCPITLSVVINFQGKVISTCLPIITYKKRLKT